TVLHRCESLLRNVQLDYFHVGEETHLAELSGPQIISRIWERHLVADRARPRIQAAIECIKLSILRINFTVAENQLELKAFDIGVSLLWIWMSRNEIGEGAFADGDDGFDRIDL